MPVAAMKHPGDGLPAQFGRGEVVDFGDSPQLVVGPINLVCDTDGYAPVTWRPLLDHQL
jgi:hypothetical protein